MSRLSTLWHFECLKRAHIKTDIDHCTSQQYQKAYRNPENCVWVFCNPLRSEFWIEVTDCQSHLFISHSGPSLIEHQVLRCLGNEVSIQTVLINCPCSLATLK